MDEYSCLFLLSLPLRECGLKCDPVRDKHAEILSLPLRECGLKSRPTRPKIHARAVTPLAGVWIEIGHEAVDQGHGRRHSPCGSVD